MNQEITIEALKIADCYESKKVINSVWRDAYKHIFPEEVFDNKDRKLQESAKKLENLLKNDKIFGFIAKNDNKIVGVVIGAYESEYEHYASLGYSDLQIIYILPEYQKCGIGSKFFNLIKNVLKQNKKTKMVICALAENHIARSVYEKWGGKLDTYQKDYIVEGKSYKDVFYLFEL